MIASSQMSSTTNIATAGQKRLVIVGATGMVGGYALRYALENPAVASVTAIGRWKLGISHPKLKEVLHGDFADCSALAETLSGQDAAVFCRGTYTGAVSDAELRALTVDYTIARRCHPARGSALRKQVKPNPLAPEMFFRLLGREELANRQVP